MWDDLRYFLAVARQGTLAKAGRGLRASSATVSRRITALEAKLGAVLFVRHQTGYTLTEAGRGLVADGERIEEAMVALEQGAMGRDTRLEGAVRFATFETFAHDVLIPNLSPFLEQHPGVSIEVVVSLQSARLSRREADLAVRVVRPSAPGLLLRRLGSFGLALYRRRSLEPRRGRAGRDWRQLPVVAWDEEYADLAAARWLERELGELRPRLRATSMQAQIQAVRAGVAVGVIPCFIGDADPALERLSGAAPAVPLDLWLVQAHEVGRNARVRAFSDYVVELVAHRAAALAGGS